MRASLSILFVVVLPSCVRETISTTAPSIDVQPLALDFGPIPNGLKVSLPVQVRNLGKSALVISEVRVDNADFSAAIETITIGAGEKVSVDLSFQPSMEGTRDGVVHLINNSTNDTDVAIVVTGVGTPRLVCVECNAPPANYCASSSTLISYQPHGTCVANKCEYQAITTICGGMCVMATNTCSAPMMMDAGVDAGVVDAGVDAGMDAGVDAGVDAGEPDAGNVFTTPGVTMWTVPAGVTSVTIDAWGGGGAGGAQMGATGGGGAYVRATLAVTPGEVLELQIAEGGVTLGNGAGATAVKRGSTSLIIAAGGGGAGSDGNSGNSGSNGRGGAGGALTGQNGQNLVGTIAPYCTGATGGQGGTQSAGGLGGSATGTAMKCSGQPGDSGGGGKASGVNGTCDMGLGAIAWQQGGGQGNGGGGAGGSGYFGGGGAGFIWTYCAGGGGGGSSFIIPSATMAMMVGGNDRTQGNASTSAGAGEGGPPVINFVGSPSGKNGRLVLTF